MQVKAYAEAAASTLSYINLDTVHNIQWYQFHIFHIYTIPADPFNTTYLGTLHSAAILHVTITHKTVLHKKIKFKNKFCYDRT